MRTRRGRGGRRGRRTPDRQELSSTRPDTSCGGTPAPRPLAPRLLAPLVLVLVATLVPAAPALARVPYDGGSPNAAAADGGADSGSRAAASTAGADAGATGTGSGATTGATTVEGADTGPPPALGAIGMSGGFPSFQTAAPYLSVQAQYVGFQVKASLTPVGPYVGLELRGYPPVPLPVPLYVGVGGGFYGGRTTYFGALGAAVPLSLHVRLDVEAGAANVPLLDTRAWAPYLSLGVSYAFSFTPTRTSGDFAVAAPLTIGDTGPACTSPTAPDPAQLLPAFHRVLTGFLDSARATYGSVYTDLHYRYDVTSASVHGDVGRVVIHYSGSVRAIATGKRSSASGTASATFQWTGCGWSETGIHY